MVCFIIFHPDTLLAVKSKEEGFGTEGTIRFTLTADDVEQLIVIIITGPRSRYTIRLYRHIERPSGSIITDLVVIITIGNDTDRVIG